MIHCVSRGRKQGTERRKRGGRAHAGVRWRDKRAVARLDCFPVLSEKIESNEETKLSVLVKV